MINLDKTKLAKLIYEDIRKSNEDKIDLDKYCAQRLKIVNPDISDLEIADELDEIVEKVKFYINKRKEHCESQGITPEYEFNHYPANFLIHYSIKYGESICVSQLRKHKKDIINIINRVHWHEFENLCKYALKQKGISQIKLTTKNQEGIDFCGLFNIGNCPSMGFIPPNFKIRVIGQVKHYTKKISPSLIRAFHTYYESIQQGDPAIIRKLPPWFNQIKSPILCIFMTTSDFTRRANDYAEKEWIILKNGEQIAEDLITSPDANKWLLIDKHGQYIFNKKAFKNTFNKIT